MVLSDFRRGINARSYRIKYQGFQKQPLVGTTIFFETPK